MKKLLLIEVAVLVVLLIVAAVVNNLPEKPEEPAVDAGAVDTTPVDTTPVATEPEPTWATFPENRVITAKQYFVYDCDANAFTTISGQATDKIYPASITKLFTAYVAMQYLQPDTQLTAAGALDLVGPNSSVAQIEKGNVLTTAMLVKGLLLPSGNDAAYILAEEVGKIIKNDRTLTTRAAVAVFVEEMNRQAQALGMTGTHFTNPDGYHNDDHYTNYNDLVTLSKLSLKDDTIMAGAKISSELMTFVSGEQKLWKNTNELVNEQSEYYCPYAIGMKTGQTPRAGCCLLSAFDVKGKTYVIGVFGSPEEDGRFEDTLQLLNKTLGK